MNINLFSALSLSEGEEEVAPVPFSPLVFVVHRALSLSNLFCDRQTNIKLDLWLPNGSLWMVAHGPSGHNSGLQSWLTSSVSSMKRESMSLKLLGFTVIHDAKHLGSTEVDTGVIHWEWLYE